MQRKVTLELRIDGMLVGWGTSDPTLVPGDPSAPHTVIHELAGGLMGLARTLREIDKYPLRLDDKSTVRALVEIACGLDLEAQESLRGPLDEVVARVDTMQARMTLAGAGWCRHHISMLNPCVECHR